MKERGFEIIGMLLAIVLWGTVIFFFMKLDRVPPVIHVDEMDLTYSEGMDEELLLKGIRATDNMDGSISDKIIIEKIVSDEEKGTAVVTYGVCDSSGNVTKINRKVTLIESLRMEEALPEPALEEENPEQSEAEEEGAAERATQEDSQEEQESNDSREASQDSGQNNSSQNSNDTQNNNTQGNDGNSQNTDGSSSAESNRGRPSIILRDSNVSAAKGSNPKWVDVIEGLHDDKDNYATLLGSLKVYGEYDRNNVGSYQVSVTVTDSDGNESNPVPITIAVQ